MEILDPLPAGIELAIGCNRLTRQLHDFCQLANWRGWIVNLTINQDHVNRDWSLLKNLIDTGSIRGLGISYRSDFATRHNQQFSRLPQLIAYENTVVHVIEGIDNFESVMQLQDLGIRKILVLGEKDFGFNLGCPESSPEHLYWVRNIHRMFDQFEIVSFDNLAIDRLDIARFFKKESWDQFHQGEHSFYINAVDGYFAPSSRSTVTQDWNQMSIHDYFKNLPANQHSVS